ncbi:MAG: hypothetical protein ABSH08_08195 [Tepidisphaeraceae bacterium]|jgi:hypothetical protein
MHLTASERNRLKKLRAWHKRPPTYGRMLPKAIALVLVWLALAMAFGILSGGLGCPLMFYRLGLATFFPILAINLVVRSVTRWRINEAITNWDRVDQLLSSADRTGA